VAHARSRPKVIGQIHLANLDCKNVYMYSLRKNRNSKGPKLYSEQTGSYCQEEHPGTTVDGSCKTELATLALYRPIKPWWPAHIQDVRHMVTVTAAAAKADMADMADMVTGSSACSSSQLWRPRRASLKD